MRYVPGLQLILLVFGVLTSVSALSEPTTIRSAMQDNNTLKFDPKNTRLPGLCIEVMRAVEKVDPEIKFVGLDKSLPLLRIQSEMVSGNLDGFCGLLKNPEREGQVNFLDTVLYSIKHKVAVRADDNLVVNGFDDIRKLSGDNVIITTFGQAYVAFLEAQGGLKIDAGGKDNSSNLQKLLSGRGRFFYSSESNLLEYIANDKLEGKVKILPAVFREENQYFVVSKTLPAPQTEKLRKALQKAAQQGEFSSIYKKYIP